MHFFFFIFISANSPFSLFIIATTFSRSEESAKFSHGCTVERTRASKAVQSFDDDDANEDVWILNHQVKITADAHKREQEQSIVTAGRKKRTLELNFSKESICVARDLRSRNATSRPPQSHAIALKNNETIARIVE